MPGQGSNNFGQGASTDNQQLGVGSFNLQQTNQGIQQQHNAN
jgi:hypothetical protein